jgi:hypothetical protein
MIKSVRWLLVMTALLVVFGKGSPAYSAEAGFIYHNGVYQTLEFPYAVATTVFGINNLDDVVGNYYAGGGSAPQMFVYSSGAYVTIPIPPPNYNAAAISEPWSDRRRVWLVI